MKVLGKHYRVDVQRLWQEGHEEASNNLQQNEMFQLTTLQLRKLINEQLRISLLRNAVRCCIITEGRLDDIKARYPDVNVDNLAKNDPSGSLKYVEWMARQLSAGATPEDLYPTISYFHRNIFKFPSKDINSYKTLKDLEDAAKAASEIQSRGEQRKQIKATGAKTLLTDDDYSLTRIDTREACQFYGAGTKWCITMRDASYFEQYTGENIVFYFLTRTSPKGNAFDKIALVIKRDKNNKVLANEMEAYNARDKNISIDTLKKRVPHLDEYIDVALADATHQPKGLIAKINDGEASAEEELKAIEMYTNDKDRESILSQIEFKTLEALSLLAKDKNDYIREKVADNLSTPVEILLTLAKDENKNVRERVANNLSTPVEILLMLAKDAYDHVKDGVAYNSSTSPEILTMLAKDKSENVRFRVAYNPHTPPKTLAMLATDENKNVRIYVAENDSTPIETLVMLAKDENEIVRQVVNANKHMKNL